MIFPCTVCGILNVSLHMCFRIFFFFFASFMIKLFVLYFRIVDQGLHSSQSQNTLLLLLYLFGFYVYINYLNVLQIVFATGSFKPFVVCIWVNIDFHVRIYNIGFLSHHQFRTSPIPRWDLIITWRLYARFTVEGNLLFVCS